MGTDKNQVRDSADVRLEDPTPVGEGKTFAVDNEVRVVAEDGSEPPLDGRPAKGAGRDAWVDYCVALGADRHYLENDTVHIVDATPGNEVVEDHAPLSVSDLREYADRLGG